MADRIGSKAVACPTPGIVIAPTTPKQGEAHRQRRCAPVPAVRSDLVAGQRDGPTAEQASRHGRDRERRFASRTDARPPGRGQQREEQQCREEAAEPATLRHRRTVREACRASITAGRSGCESVDCGAGAGSPPGRRSRSRSSATAAMTRTSSGTWESRPPPRTSIGPGRRRTAGDGLRPGPRRPEG